MKNLAQYITEHQEFIAEYCKMLDQINLEIITESFKCNILREYVDQQAKLIDKWRDAKASYIYGSYTEPLNLTKVFKNFHLYWDKITDDQVQTFVGADTEGLKLFKRVCSNRTNSVDGIIIIESSNKSSQDEPKYSAIIIKTNNYIDLYLSTQDRLVASLKPSEATSYLSANTVYHIIVIDTSMYTDKLRTDRSNSKYGMLEPGNVEQLKRLAEQNRERYRKLAAKMKVDRQAATNELPKKVTEVVDKVMNLSIEFAKDPVKYASFEYDIKKLMDLVGDKQTGYYDKGKYNKYGINGLMYYYSSYLTTLLSMGKGSSYEYEEKNNESAKLKLEEMINKINTTYDEIVGKANNIKSN